MSFWSELPDLSRPVFPGPIPKDVLSKIYQVKNWPEAKRVSIFLAEYFGNPPKTPILRIPPSELFQDEIDSRRYTFYWQEDGQIVGTIRYRLWALKTISGSNTPIPIWLVDAFCVHPKFRGKKIGTWLLKYLHSWANQRGIPYAAFLKEGHPLTIPKLPFKTGIYAYLKIQENYAKPIKNIKRISFQLAENWLKAYGSITSKRETLKPVDTLEHFSAWYLYRSDRVWLILRAENTNQFSIGSTVDTQWNTKIHQLGWITHVYESPSWVTLQHSQKNNIITEASEQIAKELNWESVWISSEWVEEGDIWKIDGPYYFYSFQW